MEDPIYRASRIARSVVQGALRRQSINKSARTAEIMGCTAAEFKIHIESTWQPGWTWENHGSVWQVDHKVPVSYFDLRDPAQLRKCCHWLNLRAYLAFDNMSEKARR